MIRADNFTFGFVTVFAVIQVRSYNSFPAGGPTALALGLQGIFQRRDQTRCLRIELQQMNPRQSAKNPPAPGCDPQTHASMILWVRSTFEQTFFFATINQFHDAIMFQPQGICRIRN